MYKHIIHIYIYCLTGVYFSGGVDEIIIVTNADVNNTAWPQQVVEILVCVCVCVGMGMVCQR